MAGVENPPDAQLFGHLAAVLPGRSAEGDQAVIAWVVAASQAYCANRFGHVRTGHLAKTFAQFFQRKSPAGRFADLVGHLLQPPLHRLAVEREGELLLRNPAQVKVHVRNGQRPPGSVAGRSRVGPGALRPNKQPRAVEPAQRASAGGHRVDGQHGGDDAHPGFFGFVFQLQATVVAGNVGAGPSHVEADDAFQPGRSCHPGGSHHAASRAGQHAVLARESLGLNQPPGRSHHSQRASRAELVPDAVQVISQYRGQIGIHHRGIASGNQLDVRGHLVAQAHLGKAQLPSHLAHQQLVLRIGIGVQQGHGQGVDPPAAKRSQGGFHLRRLQRLEHLPLGVHPPRQFHDGGKQDLGLANRQLEQPGPVLVANPQHIAQSPGGYKRRSRTGSRQQSVGAPGGAQLHLHRRQCGL